MLSLLIIWIFVTLTLIDGQSNMTLVRQGLLHRSQKYDEILINGPFDVILSDKSSDGFILGQSNPLIDIETSLANQAEIVVNIIDDHILSIRTNKSFPDQHIPRLFIRYPSAVHLAEIRRIQRMNSQINFNGTLLSSSQSDEPIISVQLNVNIFHLILSGAKQIKLTGSVREQAIFSITGMVQVDASKLLPKRAVISVQGNSIIQVIASDDIEVDAQGTSKVFYKLISSQRPTKLITDGQAKILSSP